jgi:hypothetical protein
MLLGSSATTGRVPWSDTPPLDVSGKQVLALYVIDPELGYFRLKPWLGRHLVVLAECGLKAIRSPDVIEIKKRSSKENKEVERSKQRTSIHHLSHCYNNNILSAECKRRKKAALQGTLSVVS